MAIHILRRDRYARTIEIECPHCRNPVPDSPQHVTKLADGLEIIGTCPHCRQPLEVPPEELVRPG